MRTRFLLGLAALTLVACDTAALDPAPLGPRAENTWIRLPAVAGRPGAAYFTLRGGMKAATLIGVESPQAERIELHESMTGGGMARMVPLQNVALPVGAALAFKPGGRHAMLFGIAPELKPLATAVLRLRFANGEVVEARAVVLGAGDPPPQFVAPETAGAACKPGITREGDRIIVTNCGE